MCIRDRRYTESKLTRYSEVLLSELSDGTVDWQPNFDGTLEEPTFLPARLPNVLLNGTQGIAVGMSTDIPPHNLREVAQACIHLLDEPDAQTRTLMKYVKGPDLPTGGEIITPRSDLLQILREVAQACIHLLDEPDAQTRTLMKYVKGPDLPTGGEIITPRSDLLQIYNTGNGTFK